MSHAEGKSPEQQWDDAWEEELEAGTDPEIASEILISCSMKPWKNRQRCLLIPKQKEPKRRPGRPSVPPAPPPSQSNQLPRTLPTRPAYGPFSLREM